MTEPEPWRMCAPCGAAWSAWLDTRPSVLIPRPGFAHGSGAAYDVSAAGIKDGRRARHEEWRRTVRHSQRLISEGCRAGRHAEVDTSQSSL